MLHEILLSLSGHPSPLLRSDGPAYSAQSALSPQEIHLLNSVGHLSDVHVKIVTFAAQIRSSHPSTICRAVATTIETRHLAVFQRHVVDVEKTILLEDSSLVGAYNIVPLTAIVAEFTPWTRRMEWLWDTTRFMLAGEDGSPCSGVQLIDRLRAELQSGYADIEETASTLVASAEAAWLKQVSAWILYGRLPGFGADDFFVQKRQTEEDDDAAEFVCDEKLLPGFVSSTTASSMLFIGKSLNHVRVKRTIESGRQGWGHVAAQLAELSTLTYPLHAASFSRTVMSVRTSLSRNILQTLLPLSRVVEILQLLRDFFLLGRGEFAMVLAQEADRKNRDRWRRAENLAYGKRSTADTTSSVVVKQGEVAQVLSSTWATMGGMQGLHAEEDEGLELARELLRLQLVRPSATDSTPGLATDSSTAPDPENTLASTPFRNLLFSAPVILTLSNIPSPLDMFLTPADLQTYSAIHAYLQSIRRAHLRLTDLWKITSLRRHHPAPPGPPLGSSPVGRPRVVLLRERQTQRSLAMRSVWVASSAAVFFLAETEAYLQSEVVSVLWDGLHSWLTSPPPETTTPSLSNPSKTLPHPEEDLWLPTPLPNPNPNLHPPQTQHDPESLTKAHKSYLQSLTSHLLLPHKPYTTALYKLLAQTDHLAALTHRLNTLWTSQDLETDAGVIDAFLDIETEERDVRAELRVVERAVRDGIAEVVHAMRSLGDETFVVGDGADADDTVVSVSAAVGTGGERGGVAEEAGFVPGRVGGLSRLLMKLDFGSWAGGEGL